MADENDNTMVAIDPRTGKTRKLVRIGRVTIPDEGFSDGQMVRVKGMPQDESGAMITVEHTLDPEAQATLRELRRGAPVAAAAGGVLVGAALAVFVLWALADDE